MLTNLDRSSIMYDMNNISFEKRCAVIRCLVEGCSIRSTVRMTGVAKNTIQKLTREMGEACLEFQDKVFRNLPCKKIQADEIWNFCYCKDKNVPNESRKIRPNRGTAQRSVSGHAACG
jgi:transposase